MMYERLFGEVRSSLSRGPSEMTFGFVWEGLVALWRAHPERTNAEAMPYVRDTLKERWPDDTRVVRAGPWTQSWLEAPQEMGILEAARALRLANQQLGDSLAMRIRATSALAGVRELDLTNNLLSPGAAVALATSPHLAGVTHLRLNKNRWGDAGVSALVKGPWPGLELLELRSVGCSDLGALAISEASGLANLRRLILENNQIGLRGQFALRARYRDVELAQNARAALF